MRNNEKFNKCFKNTHSPPLVLHWQDAIRKDVSFASYRIYSVPVSHIWRW